MLQVDDLVEPGPEQIAATGRLVLLRPHRVPPTRQRNHGSRTKGIPKTKSQGSRASKPETLQSISPGATGKPTRIQPLSRCSRTTKYSPEVSPIEQVFAKVRTCCAKQQL